MSREEIPAGWCVTPLAKCVDVLDSRRVPVNSEDRAKRPGRVPYYGATGQVGWIDEHLFEEDLLLIGEDGAPFFDKSKPIAYLISGKSWVNNHAHVLRAIGTITTNQYLKYFLDAFSFEGYVNGTTRLKLTQAAMNSIPVLLPPLPEQRRIVAKLEALLAKVDASRKRLERIPVILKRFRQAVLAAACDGRLTEDWRGENPNTQDAEELLSEVFRLRRERYQSECAAARARGQQTPQLELNAINPDFSEYDLPDIPTSWRWSHVSQFGFVKGGKRIPKGQSLTDKDTGHPYLRIRDLKNGTVDSSEIMFINTEIFNEIKNYTINHGDVYITIVGSIGESGIIPIEFDGANLTENAAKIVQPIGIIPKYLVSWFNSIHCQQIITANIHSGGQGKLALFRIEQLPIPLAPTGEQEEIVKRVDRLFEAIDQIEARYTKAKAQVDRLTQSILAKAFRGELVPQDPSDEPADALLSRLAAAPAEASAPTRRRGRPPRMQPAAPSVVPAAPAEDREAPVLADLTLDAILQAHRDVLASIPSPLDEDQFLRSMALRLGFQRLGSRIKARLRFVLLQEGIRLS